MLCDAIVVLCGAVPVLYDAVLVRCDAVPVLGDAVTVLCDAVRGMYKSGLPTRSGGDLCYTSVNSNVTRA
jgi:hypothetical protein